MQVSLSMWGLTIAGILALLAYDFIFHVRKAHAPTLKEAAVWSAAYVGVAILFGVGVLVLGGVEMGSEYFSGYITEKALSVDNLFVFLIIIANFRVPREAQQKVLLFGVVFALVARTGLIFLGSALINSFAWIFYIFGLVLLLTAGKFVRPEEEESHSGDNVVVRLASKVFHTTDRYDGDKLFTVRDGRRATTPMLMVMVTIGGTDVLFALDAIPAIFGLTQNVYLVFTATAFSLLGLRQLYFLIDGLLHRLIYLSYGLAGTLGFIGVKQILHALHENNVPFINEGEPVPVMEVSTGLSLTVIIAILVATVLASLLSPAGKAKSAIANARRHARACLDSEYTADPVERERIFRMLLDERDQILALGPKQRQLMRNESALTELIELARSSHEAAVTEKGASQQQARRTPPALGSPGVLDPERGSDSDAPTPRAEEPYEPRNEHAKGERPK